MAKFQNKYRIASARAYWWDYNLSGIYFVTICTHNRRHYFGEILDEQLQHSATGLIAEQIWSSIPEYYPWAELGEFVIMPNHVHGIVIINNNNNPHSITPKGGITGNFNPMLHDGLGKIIRWYKGRCTFEIRKINPNFEWQSRYHDRIIRDDAAYQRIACYINNNQKNWKSDKFNALHP